MMRRIGSLLLLTLAGFTAPAFADDADALATIDACVARLDAQVDVGYERISSRCPNLAPALERTGWAAWLPPSWKETRNDLSAGSLKELRRLVVRELATPPAARTPRVEQLHSVLSDLGTAGQERSGAWVRFKKWVRSLFERSGQQQRDGWLDQMISRMGVSDAVIELITYAALGVVVALAAFIVWNELRIAGVFRSGRANARAENARSQAARRTRPVWSDVERADLVERPRLLLELIAGTLTDLERLPPATAFTAREIVRSADLSAATDRQSLKELALTAERARYAAQTPSESAIRAALGDGRSLLQRLEEPSGDVAEQRA